MPRRRSAGTSGPPWLFEFVEADWPGRCSLERLRAWRAAQRAGATDIASAASAARAARRALVHPADCPVHPLPTVRPCGWNRGPEETVFTLIDSDDSISTEKVSNDSLRDRELRQSFEEWLQWLG